MNRPIRAASFSLRGVMKLDRVAVFVPSRGLKPAAQAKSFWGST